MTGRASFSMPFGSKKLLTFPWGKVRERPRRRQPSPTGKVDRAQPGPDEGKQPKSEKQAPLYGSNLHPMWPVSLFGCGPLIRHALRRATFPVGEGDLPAGAFHTLSFGEGFFEIPRKKPFTFGNTYVRISPLVMASITFVPSAQLREKTQGGISPNPILS